MDGLDKANVHIGDNHENTPLVGMIAASFYWRSVIRDILPTGSRGMVVVFENPCNEAFTYQIDGPKETYLGTGDVHNRRYNHLGIHGKLLNLNDFAIRDSKYTGAPIDDMVCPFSLHLYPSDDMYGQFATNNGIAFALSAVAIFVFTSRKFKIVDRLWLCCSYSLVKWEWFHLTHFHSFSVVFVLYDFYVERRQKLVMNKAERSSAIVSNLFPSAVRDQLYISEEKGPKKQTHKNTFRRDAGDQGLSSEEKAPLLGPPIANLYPETTILCTFYPLISVSPAHVTSNRIIPLLSNLQSPILQVSRHGPPCEY